MDFKSPSVVSSTSNCSDDTCNSLLYGREIEAIDRKAGTRLPKIDLGPVPSPVEVDAAVAALQSLLQESFSLGSVSKWLQPLMNSCDSSILHSRGYRLLCKGLQWLLTDPTFKGLVISLCLDKDVWNAIRNNGIVEKLQELPSSEGGNGNPESSKQGPDFGNAILSWILLMSLTKIRELIENFVFLLNNAFRFPGKEKLKAEKRDEIDEKIQSSFFLSLVILLIVIVARVQMA
ncbi:uncharacterized protein LOC120068201 [Benincasa hispida]|uniref:uncharacterized protein LOC120068201 n=1 Tax=Benincasa hispida TaxID=102211 RepID=UPI0019001D5A|nr:uncharacterized protein LOC120068201 [Benincasa hispida]